MSSSSRALATVASGLSASAASEQLLERLTDFLARLDPEGVLAYVSRAGRQWLAHPEEAVAKGAALWPLVHPDDQEATRALLRRAAAGERQEAQLRLRRPDGETVWVACRVLPLLRPGRDELLFAAWDISAFKSNEARLAQAAAQDNLTGLDTRERLLERLAGLAAGTPTGAPFAVMHLDIDGFRRVNDSLGHAAGDGVLVEIGHRLRETLRCDDTVARLGADEFGLILPEVCDAEAVAMVARKLLAAVQRPIAHAEHVLRLSASIGVAMHPDHGGAGQLLQHAAIALGQARALGRNRWQIYDPHGGDAAERRLRLEQQMYLAVQNGEFQMYFQPLFRAGDRRVVGVEALMRWFLPDGEAVSPVEFIPLAEESGLIEHLGHWSLRAACHQVARWNATWACRLTASVNISPRQFQEVELAGAIRAVLAESGLPADCLSLEITEGVLMQDPETTQSRLQELRRDGTRVAVDDFGTGYSSLAYLKRFPLSTLKIDRSFVRDLESDANDRAIVSAILGLAREMGLGVVAEGVETAGQLTFLEDKGCAVIQGFMLGVPVNAETFERQVESGAWRL